MNYYIYEYPAPFLCVRSTAASTSKSNASRLGAFGLCSYAVCLESRSWQERVDCGEQRPLRLELKGEGLWSAYAAQEVKFTRTLTLIKRHVAPFPGF